MPRTRRARSGWATSLSALFGWTLALPGAVLAFDGLRLLLASHPRTPGCEWCAPGGVLAVVLLAFGGPLLLLGLTLLTLAYLRDAEGAEDADEWTRGEDP